jgi:hypothetical protein
MMEGDTLFLVSVLTHGQCKAGRIDLVNVFRTELVAVFGQWPVKLAIIQRLITEFNFTAKLGGKRGSELLHRESVKCVLIVAKHKIKIGKDLDADSTIGGRVGCGRRAYYAGNWSPDRVIKKMNRTTNYKVKLMMSLLLVRVRAR